MNTHPHKCLSLMGGVCLLALLAGLLGNLGRVARAAPTIHYVAPGGSCGSASPCYGTVQAAVDAAAPGDEIRLAAGVYSGVNNQGGKSQVVYLDKSLTLRGGFTTSDWNTPNPQVNVTEINAQTLGRVVYVSGENTHVSLNGLRFTYGDASGLGGHQPTTLENYDAGGNLYLDAATVDLRDCIISDGASPSNGYAGGLYLRDGTLTMENVVLTTNEAGRGGGAFLYHATSVIDKSRFAGNRTTTPNGEGAGLTASGGEFTLKSSVIESNSADQKAPFSGGLSINTDHFLVEGSLISDTLGSAGVALGGNGTLRASTVQGNQYGGLRIGDGVITVMNSQILNNGTSGTYVEAGVVIDGVWDMTVTLLGNHIAGNRNLYVSSCGGGVYIDPTDAGWITLSQNIIENNIAGDAEFPPEDGNGAGVCIHGDRATLEKNIIQGNQAIGFLDPLNNQWGGRGGGVFIDGNPILRNNVVAGNRATFRGAGIYVSGSAPELYHTTIVHNGVEGEDATGVYAAEASSTERAQPKLWNTIVMSQTVGMYAAGDDPKNIIIADGVLWYGNGDNTSGAGTFFLSNEHSGDPLFVDAAGGDYHLSAGSAAIDQGVTTTTADDLDGQMRFGVPDLGADEYWEEGAYNFTRVYFPLTIK